MSSLAEFSSSNLRDDIITASDAHVFVYDSSRNMINSVRINDGQVIDFADFSSLKELLGVTDGNLASHTKALEKVEFIRIEKKFIGRKPNTKYIITDLGKQEFKKHIDALEKLIKNK